MTSKNCSAPDIPGPGAPNWHRWCLAMLMSAGVGFAYVDRANISLLVLAMKDELHLTALTQGVILSAFAWGYVLCMIPGGVLVDRIGGLRAAALSALGWSMTTAFCGLAPNGSTVILARAAVGGCEAPLFPANARIISEEFPGSERARATAIFDAGSYLAMAVSAPILGSLVASAGWRAAFGGCTLAGLAWAAAWKAFAPRLVGSGTGSRPTARLSGHPESFLWMLRDRRVLGAGVGFFCYNYSKSFFLTWMPSYLVQERGFTLLTVGWAAALPPLCAVAGELGAGYATDRMVARGASINVARKLPICLGLALASSVSLTTFITSQWGVLAVLSLAFAATIAASPGIWSIPADIAPGPAWVGRIGAVQNTFANLANILAPIITGALAGTAGGFQRALLLSAGIALTGALAYWLGVGPLSPIKVPEGSRR